MLGTETALWFMNIAQNQAFIILHFSQTRTLFRNNKLYDQPFMVPYVQDITNQAQLSPEQQMIHLKLKNKWGYDWSFFLPLLVMFLMPP